MNVCALWKVMNGLKYRMRIIIKLKEIYVAKTILENKAYKQTSKQKPGVQIRVYSIQLYFTSLYLTLLYLILILLHFYLFHTV